MKKIAVLLAVCLSCLVSCGQLSNQAAPPPPPFKGVWEIDAHCMPTGVTEFKLIITDSIFTMNTTKASGEKIITKSSYTFNDSTIYTTIISASLNGVEDPSVKGVKGKILYSFNNGVLTIFNNGITTFHRI